MWSIAPDCTATASAGWPARNRKSRIVPFRGEYYDLVPERTHLVRTLIYPVPDPKFPFLGVHFTRRIQGGVDAGPNAVLAFKREGYKRTDFNLRDLAGTLTYSGFWHMARKYWRDGASEYYRSLSKGAFVRALQRLVPEIVSSDLVADGSGVRAQAVRPDGSMVDDFQFVQADQDAACLERALARGHGFPAHRKTYRRNGAPGHGRRCRNFAILIRSDHKTVQSVDGVHGGHSAMSFDLSGKRVAVLGAGKMGGILLKALLEKGTALPKATFATVHHEDRARALAEKLGVSVGTDNLAAVRNADIIFVCVKPQVVQEVMEQIRPNVSSKQLIISVAASVPTSHIEKALGMEVPVVRAMPNTPCARGTRHDRLCAKASSPTPITSKPRALFSTWWEKLLSSTRNTWTRSPHFRPAARRTSTSFWNRLPRRV